ncbi:hypothetical protein RJT34_17670 [Clitoria ternatea]|uniref:RNase H type-1 domain-containing protein n=1 Tax=Clitoria ternatea TaxID=43366 RepID=A0AAN9JCH1_CLITE
MRRKWIPPEMQTRSSYRWQALQNPGRSGFVGIITEYEGEWLIGYSFYSGIVSNLYAKLTAIVHSITISNQEISS